MKLIVMSFLTFISASAFAGTSTFWKNNDLGFSIIASPMSDILEICDAQDTCLQFSPNNAIGKDNEYTEVSGKCKITLDLVDTTYRDGSKDQFMLDLMYQVLKVKEGYDNCKLNATYGGKRSLTGIYL